MIVFRCLFLLCFTGNAMAFTYSFRQGADGSANIFAAGQISTASLGGGALPTEMILAPGVGRSMQVGNVTGTTKNTVSSSNWGPDGFSFNVNINPSPGISGLYAGRAMALLGVFMDYSVPLGDSPPTIDFTSDTGITRNFYNLSPTTGQVFLIGDGWASVSDQQRFFIPDNAGRLFIGFADAGGFQGNPSNFFDNSGRLTATFALTIPDPAPEPSGLALMGIAALAALRRRRRSGASRI